MPSNRLVVALAVTALAGVAGPAASAKAGGNGGGHGNGSKQPTVSSYGDKNDVLACLPGADTCTASGTVDLTTDALQSSSTVKRTTSVTGRDAAADLAYAGQYFLLSQPAKSVTATLHFTGIKVADSTDAQSPDNSAYAIAQIGASITDSGCSTYGCGATDAQKHVWVDDEVQSNGVTLTPIDNSQPSTADATFNSAADQTITVTLSMPDGSNLPAGRISFAGYTYAYSSLGDRQCTPSRTPSEVPPQLRQDLPQQCLPETPHTGFATSTLSAQLASITYTVN